MRGCEEYILIKSNWAYGNFAHPGPPPGLCSESIRGVRAALKLPAEISLSKKSLDTLLQWVHSSTKN